MKQMDQIERNLNQVAAERDEQHRRSVDQKKNSDELHAQSRRLEQELGEKQDALKAGYFMFVGVDWGCHLLTLHIGCLIGAWEAPGIERLTTE